MKLYKVIRVVAEIYEVQAKSKTEARKKVQDPHTVRVIHEIVELAPAHKETR